jgi:hypothetical protein
VQILSYINNLHPVAHADLYPVLERLCELFLPMWERVLTSLKAPVSARIPIAGDWYEPPPDVAVKLAKEKEAAKEAKKAAAKAEGKDEEEEEDEEEEDEDEDMDEDDYFAGRTLYLPDVRTSFKAPLIPAEKSVTLTSRRLQIIVKLANIILTPDKPKYNGGSWHVEGMKVRKHLKATAAGSTWRTVS